MPERADSAQTRQSDTVPASIAAILADSLTERGMRQWWFSHNRHIDGRPCEAWGVSVSRVKEAAIAFSEGFYL